MKSSQYANVIQERMTYILARKQMNGLGREEIPLPEKRIVGLLN